MTRLLSRIVSARAKLHSVQSGVLIERQQNKWCGVKKKQSTEVEVSHHHLVTELVIERVGEKTCDRGQAVHNVERQAAIVTQHH